MSVQKDALHVESVLSKKILHFLKLLGAGDTTSLRQEDKFVLNADTVGHTLKELSRLHGHDFQLRDAVKAGRKNITGTQYALLFVWKSGEGKSISAKIRFRKYYDADTSVALEKAEMTPAAFVKEHQFVERKIDHPVFRYYDRSLRRKSNSYFAAVRENLLRARFIQSYRCRFEGVYDKPPEPTFSSRLRQVIHF